MTLAALTLAAALTAAPLPADDPNPLAAETATATPGGAPEFRLIIPAATPIFTLTVEAPTITTLEAEPLRVGPDGTWTEYVADLPRMYVHDTRPGAPAWQLTGRLANLTGPAGTTLSAQHAGWDPLLTVPGMGAVAAPTIVPGYPTGEGMLRAQVLASAPTGHAGDPATSAGFAGKLRVRVHPTLPAGEYRAVLTLTLIS